MLLSDDNMREMLTPNGIEGGISSLSKLSSCSMCGGTLMAIVEDPSWYLKIAFSFGSYN